MIRAGQLVLFHFPATDQTAAKLRPALVLRKLPGPFDDWLTCMISTQLGQQVPGFDELITASDSDFALSGLKVASVVRVTRLAVVHRSILRGAIGTIAPDRLRRIQTCLGQWLSAP